MFALRRTENRDKLGLAWLATAWPLRGAKHRRAERFLGTVAFTERGATLMKSLDFGRYALCSCVAAAMLAACGGSRPPIGAPGAMPQRYAIATHTKKPVSGELLYASDNEGGAIRVFSYPQGGLVQTLTGFAAPPFYVCSDGRGNVFVPTTNLQSPGYIYEFAHGGTQPIETLADPGPGWALSCSVDPTTGNLAVANGNNVVVYPNAQGTPTIYEASDVGAWDCAYDGSGDLFVDGHSYGNKIAELPVGGASFLDITLNESVAWAHLLWWDKRLVTGGYSRSVHGPIEVFQVSISGSNGIVSGPVLLYGKSKHRPGTADEFALSGDTLVMPEGPGDSLLNLWHYPKGGKPYKVLDQRPRDYDFYGVAISK